MKQTEFSVAMTESMDDSLNRFLLSDMESEEICFGVWYPAKGKTRFSALIHEIVFPTDQDRKKDGHVEAFPEYVDRVKELARERRGGVVMIHTHPFGRGPQGVSQPDLHYEQDILSREIFGITGLPLVGMTLAGDGTWSARLYPEPFKIKWCDKVRIVGKNLTIHYNDNSQKPTPNGRQIRTTSVWGEKKQADLMGLTVGVIGAGSVGSEVSQILAKLGVGKIILMDYDKIKIHNLDRMPASDSDIGKYKINVLKNILKKYTTNEKFVCSTSKASVVEKTGYEIALDCDVVFSCVDRPYPRQVLNHLSYSCLIPVIDGGVSFQLKEGKLIHGVYRTQTVGPGRACLNCLKAYDPSEVQQDRDGLYDDPDYIKEFEKKTKTKTRQNIVPFVASLAGHETIQFVELVTNLGNVGDFGRQQYDYYSGEIMPEMKSCTSGCEYVGYTALGDTKFPFLSADKSRLREMKN
ncbi:MAG: ThiF family adenylyltransferase [Candidatus Nitrosotenuis sp.]